MSIKLIIAGPPHSGKSIFIELLVHAMRKQGLHPLKLDATPDGETNYVKENFNNPELLKALRKKGEYTDKLRDYIRRCVTNSKHPLMLIDIGGRFNDDDIPMLENATHAVILSGGKIVQGERKGEVDFKESVAEWKSFFSHMKIPVLTTLYSDYNAEQDYTTAEGVLAVHHLERGSVGKCYDLAEKDYASILEALDVIFSQMKKLSEGDANPTAGAGDGVGMQKAPKRESEYDELVAISKEKERVEEHNGKMVLSGGYSQHVLAMLCLESALDVGGEQISWVGDARGDDGVEEGREEGAKISEVYFHDAKLGEDIKIAPLDLGKTDRKWFEEPEYIGSFRGRRVFHIRFLANHSRNILLPEYLQALVVPDVPEGCIVKISNPGVQWIGAIMALSYAVSGKCDAVGVDLPHAKLSAVVHSSVDDIPTCDMQEKLTQTSSGVIPDLPIVYIDMDGVLADFNAGKTRVLREQPPALAECGGMVKNMPGFFESLQPIEGAIDGAKWVAENFNAYILSAAPWSNPTALQAKQDWIKRYFTGDDGFNPFKRKVIFTHHKELLKGDILIDDRITNGVSGFAGEHIWFGNATKSKGWQEVVGRLSYENTTLEHEYRVRSYEL